MSSIRNISASNSMPVDLAKKIGKNGVVEVLSVMWQGYDDLRAENVITSDMNENTITQEWYLRVNERWHRENRASRITVRLSPTVQYEDDTLAKNQGQSPTIDFCFRAWSKDEGYFGAECKNLYDHDNRHIKRYVSTGVNNYTSGRYGSKSTVSSMIGYVLTGEISEIVDDLSKEIATTKPHTNLTKTLGTRDAQYKTTHIRTLDGELIILYHLLFDFVA